MLSRNTLPEPHLTIFLEPKIDACLVLYWLQGYSYLINQSLPSALDRLKASKARQHNYCTIYSVSSAVKAESTTLKAHRLTPLRHMVKQVDREAAATLSATLLTSGILSV